MSREQLRLVRPWCRGKDALIGEEGSTIGVFIMISTRAVDWWAERMGRVRGCCGNQYSEIHAAAIEHVRPSTSQSIQTRVLQKWSGLTNNQKKKCKRRLLQPGIWLQSANPRLDHYPRPVDETGTLSAAFKALWSVVKIINAENDDVGTRTKANVMA